MGYSFLGANSKQRDEIEAKAKVDPGQAAKEYKLRKIPRGQDYCIISKLSTMQNMGIPMIGGRLKGLEEKAFLAAIKDMK